MLRKKKRNNYEKKLIAISLAVFIAVVSINPSGVIFAYGESVSAILDAEFQEVLSEDSMSATITLQIDEKDNQEIVAITMPDGSKVEKEKFEYDENKNIIVNYLASDNGELSYTVSYKEINAEADVSISEDDKQVVDEAVTDTTDVMKEEKITYEVSNIKSINDMNLEFVAPELSSPVGTEIDVMKDIVIKDEDGNDVTSLVNIEVSDYDGFSKDKVGAYKVTYRTLHPLSGEAYTFSRVINITDVKTKTNTTKTSRSATLSNDVSVQLSSGNASLKNPSDFRIGKSDQETFSITLNYQSDAVSTLRELQVIIPKGFSLEKEITNEELTNAESITTTPLATGETLIRIVWKKNIEITSSFDLSIRQDKKYLYDQANIAKYSYAFRVVSYEDMSEVKEGQLVISPEKLKNTATDKSITIDPIDKYEITYTNYIAKGSAKIGNRDANTIVIKKEAYSDLSSKQINLPSIMDANVKIDWDKRYEVLVNNKVVDSGKNFSRGDTVYLSMMPEFMYSYEDTEIRIYDVSLRWDASAEGGYLYDNPTTPFQSTEEMRIDENQFFGKISIAAKNTQKSNLVSRENNNPFVEGSDPIVVRQGIVVNDNGMDNDTWMFEYDDTTLNHANTVFEYDFPYEIQPLSFGFESNHYSNLYGRGGIYFTIETNKGRSLRLDKSNLNYNDEKRYDFSSKLTAGEYVVNLKIMAPFTGVMPIQLSYKTTTINKDGDELGNDETVKVGSKISVNGTVLYAKEYPVVLFKGSKDDLNLASINNSGVKARVGEDFILGYAAISKSARSKEYKDVYFTVEGKELLSLTKSIGILYDGTNHTIVFSTNKRNDVVLESSTDTINFPLDTDEYLVSLKVKTDCIGNTSKLDTGTFNQRIYFFTDSSYVEGRLYIPNKLPYNGESIIGKSFQFKTKLEVDGKKLETMNRTSTYIGYKDPSISFPIVESGGYIYPNSPLISTKISTATDGGLFRNLLMDYSETEEKLLSLVGSLNVKIDRNSTANHTGWKLKYTTNKGEEKDIDITPDRMTIYPDAKYKLDLKKGEYVTKLWVEIDQFKGDFAQNCSIDFYMRDDSPRTYPIDGSLIGGSSSVGYDNLSSKVKWSAKDVNEASKSGNIKIYGDQKFTVTTPSADKKVEIVPTQPSSYQNETFDITINNLPFTITDSYTGSAYQSGPENYIRIMNPTVYIAVDKSYSIDPKNINLQGYKADIEFENGILNDGNSLLTIAFKDYEKLFRSGDNSGNVLSLMDNLVLPLYVKPNSTEGNKTIIKSMYYDLDNSMQTYKSYIADLEMGKDVKELPVDGILNNTTPLYPTIIAANTHRILPVTEMGTASTGQAGNGAIGLDVTGYDNDTYTQELSIISNANQATYDWKLYIPVPKKGKTVKYIDAGNVLESAPADYSFNLSKAVVLADKPAGTKIEYTADADPKYSLTGNDGGNYTETPTDFNDVTMIRITIPKVEAKQKLFPSITYKVDGKKQNVGKQTALGANYYNAKVGSSSAAYAFGGGLGSYAPLVKFNLTDFEVNGIVWEDTEEIKNNKLNDTDIRKPNVEVVAKTKDNKEFKSSTNEKGEYTIKVPSSGDTTVSVTLPNKKNQTYSFVEKTSGDDGSKVDVSGEAEVTLNDSDVYGINAGLLANRYIFANPYGVKVKIGIPEQVPVTIFPTYAKVTYLESMDTTIATVSDKGVVTGKKVGKTEAELTVSNGTGGVNILRYGIEVVPANAPSATSSSIHLFQGGSYDRDTGIDIIDGEGNIIDVNDATKVSIDDTKVNIDAVGRYPIMYTINDGYQEVVHTRYIYVYGTPEFTLPKDKVLKINTDFNGLDGVSGHYTHVAKDGTLQPNTPITSFTTTAVNKTPSKADIIKVEIEANISVADDTVILVQGAEYSIDVHEHAYIHSTKDNVTVKVGQSFNDIKGMINAYGYMLIKGGFRILPVDWSAFNDFDTTIPGNTKTADIRVIDPDTKAIVSKSITINISKGVVIEAPKEINMEQTFWDIDPKENVTIKDGDGNIVPIVPSMITKNTVDVKNPGNYVIEYHYEDNYGNESTVQTIVKVHGRLEYNQTAIHQLQGDATEKLMNTEELTKLAWYMDSDGDKKPAIFVGTTTVDSSTVGKTVQHITFSHPYGLVAASQYMDRNIYTHGKVMIEKPTDMSVKVNTNVEILKGVSASYQRVNEDGTITIEKVDVTSDLGTHVTSADVVMKTIPLKASIEVVSGINNRGTASYTIAFNGLPTITTTYSEMTVRVGATKDEIKNILNASASVHYAKDAKPTDLTNQIIWEGLDDVDTSAKKGSYVITLKVVDGDGEEVSKKITIKVSDDISMNLPNVDKVIGDSFDPFEDVTVLDGDGNKVDSKDITVDDSKVDISKPGSYEVEYTYTDKYGNKKTETNTIRVNGKLMFEKLDRIDLVEKPEATYVPTQGKAYYIDYNEKRVNVSGLYDNYVDQGKVNKNIVHFNATHPVDGSKESRKQEIYVHGDIVFKKADHDKASKVNDVVALSDKVSASYKHVNDDGSIKIVEVKVTDKNVTSDKVGYVSTTANAEVEIADGVVNKKNVDIEIAFNGLGFINASSLVSFTGAPTKKQIIDAIGATAGMKNADGYVIDLTSSIDYSELDSIKLNTSGEYTVKITVVDPDGFKTYKDVTVKINILKPEVPEKPVSPINPSDPANPGNPGNPTNPNTPTTPNNPSNPDGNGSGNGSDDGDGKNDDNGNQKDKDSNKKDESITVIVKDIPLDLAKGGISDDLIKSYITVTSKMGGNTGFTIVSNNIKGKTGNYKVKIRLANGSEQTLNVNVVDDAKRDVQQPEFGRDDECFIHWLMLLLLLGYSVYSITLIMKRRNDKNKMEYAIKEYTQRNGDNYEN